MLMRIAFLVLMRLEIENRNQFLQEKELDTNTYFIAFFREGHVGTRDDKTTKFAPCRQRKSLDSLRFPSFPSSEILLLSQAHTHTHNLRLL